MACACASTATLYVLILLATSPLQQSGQHLQNGFNPAMAHEITCHLSVINVNGIPSRWSSQAVKRAPCSTGRVPSTKTCRCLPALCATYIGASAVPQPRLRKRPKHNESAEYRHRQKLRSIATHIYSLKVLICNCSPIPKIWARCENEHCSLIAWFARRSIRSVAHWRLTAVGRVR